jgi:large subunit ribosomal protein L18
MKVSQLRQQRLKRQRRNRLKLRGNSTRPRLHVFRSNRHTYIQIIDDAAGKTLVAVSEKELTETGTKTQKAILLGKRIAEKALKAKITHVAFDRGHYKYHGRIKALAESAREQGLEF